MKDNQKNQNQGDNLKQKFENLKENIDSKKTDQQIKNQYYKEIINNVQSRIKQDIDKIKAIDLDKIKNILKSNKQNPEQNQQSNKQQEVKENTTENVQQQRDNISDKGDLKQEEEKSNDKSTLNNEDQKKIENENNSAYQNQYVNKVSGYVKGVWNQTFPDIDQKNRQKIQKMKEEAKKKKIQEEIWKQYSEEELKEIQEKIPGWKSTALEPTQAEAEVEKITLRKKLRNKIAEKFNKTDTAKQLYESEQYKEFEEAKKDVKQFKEDFKDHLSNSPSNIIQGSLYLKRQITNESEVSKAIKQMRKIVPDFDLHELEEEAKEIFSLTFVYYLCGDLSMLEKCCGESALGYFKVLLKKLETEKSEPKYKQLWTVENARFSTASMAGSLPIFIFDIQAQEIHCNISKTDPKKIVDGSDDRIMRMEYRFALRYHSEADLEEFGHQWEIVELMPREVLKLLV